MLTDIFAGKARSEFNETPFGGDDLGFGDDKGAALRAMLGV